MNFDSINQKLAGYRFPAEWEKHRATWLSFPHKEASWPGKIDSIYPFYAEFVKILAKSEKVCINVNDAKMEAFARLHFEKAGADMSQISFYHFQTNDAWCRDHGPAFLVDANGTKPKQVIDWGYNAWGGKYPPFDLDDNIPTLIANYLGLEVHYPGIVMEGGSVEFNGRGTLLTSRQCLLNENRNPHLNQEQIEAYLRAFYRVENILWLDEGIEGDDTDGHIDDLTRFVNPTTVVTVIEEGKSSANYPILQKNLKDLKAMRLEDGKQLDIVELPMPGEVIFEDQPLPASYANFYIANHAVIVPTFRHENDQKALDILGSCFKDRQVIGIDSTEIIWGLGSFHCLSQQEPL